MNLCGLTMPYFAKTAHEGLQRKLDKNAASVHNQFPGAKVQKTNINVRSMYKAAHQICQNTLAVLLDTMIMTNDILIFNKKDLLWTLLCSTSGQKTLSWLKFGVSKSRRAFNRIQSDPRSSRHFCLFKSFSVGKKTPKQSCNGLSFCFFNAFRLPPC